MRTYIKINKENLRHNYLEIKSKTNKEIIAVVKENAYGHGIKEISQELALSGCKFFMVASINEALQLRKSLILSPILLLENTSDLKSVLALKLTLSIMSLKQLEDISKTKIPLSIQLFFDLGMKRDGLLPYEALEAKKIISHSNLLLTGIFAHHTCKENYEKETNILTEILKIFDNKMIYHHQSSNYILEKDDSKFLRIGGALYGLVDMPNINLKTVLKLYSPIWCIKEVKQGEEVGYGNKKTVPENGYIYTIPFGYSDGLKRNTTLLGFINGEIIKNVGNIMMNHTLMFSKNKYKIGDEIELIGDNLNINYLSKQYKTIPYEITTSLNPNLKRIIE